MSLRTTFGGHSLARKSRAERRRMRSAGPLDAGFSAVGARPPRTRRCEQLRGRDTRTRIVRRAVRRAGAAPWALLAQGAPWALRRPPVRAGLKLFSPPLVGLVLAMARDQAALVEELVRRAKRVQVPKSPRDWRPQAEVQ